jgi:tetratricopeptide (TPR) repeat protein
MEEYVMKVVLFIKSIRIGRFDVPKIFCILFVFLFCTLFNLYADDFRDASRYIDLAYGYYNRGQYQLAADTYDKAAKCVMIIPPGYRITNSSAFIGSLLVAQDGRMKSYYHLKKYDQVIKDAEILIKADRSEYKIFVYEGFLYRGRAYNENKEYNKAIVDFTEAIRCDSSTSDAYYHRAMSYTSIGQYDKARDDCNAILRRDQNNEAAKATLKYIDAVAESNAIGILTDGSLGERFSISAQVYNSISGEETNLNIPAYVFERDDDYELTIELSHGFIRNGRLSIDLGNNIKNMWPISTIFDTTEYIISDINARYSFVNVSIPSEYGELVYYTPNLFSVTESNITWAHVTFAYLDRDIAIKSKKETTIVNGDGKILNRYVNLEFKKGWNYYIHATKFLSEENEYNIDIYTGRPDSRFKWYIVEE